MDLKTFCNLYNPGDRIFYRVIHRHFDNPSEVIRTLIDGGYATEVTNYLCPICDMPLGYTGNPYFNEEMLQEDTIFCYACDEEFHTKNIRKEPLLIRTDKEWR